MTMKFIKIPLEAFHQLMVDQVYLELLKQAGVNSWEGIKCLDEHELYETYMEVVQKTPEQLAWTAALEHNVTEE